MFNIDRSPLQQTSSPSSKGDWRTALTVDLGPSNRSLKGTKSKKGPKSPMSSTKASAADRPLSSSKAHPELGTQPIAVTVVKEGEGKADQSLQASFSGAQATAQVCLRPILSAHAQIRLHSSVFRCLNFFSACRCL